MPDFSRYFLDTLPEILQCGDVEKLIRKRDNLAEDPVYFVNMDKIYDIIKRAHISSGHGGRDKMIQCLSRYANITRGSIELFKSLCTECQKKRKRASKKGLS